MLKDLRKKMSLYGTDSSISLTHLGGAAHNPNILSILDEVLGSRRGLKSTNCVMKECLNRL